MPRLEMAMLKYQATTAQWHAQRRVKRPKTVKLAINVVLRQYVQNRLSGAVTTQNGVRFDPQLA